MKRFVVIFLVQFSIITIFAQRKGNFGMFFGGSYYMGDINYSKHFYKPSLAIGGLYRHDFNDRHAAKLSVYYGRLKADDADFEDDFRAIRNYSFSTTLVELALNYEFNFLPFNYKRKKENCTPYVSFGIGYTNFLGNTGANCLVVPFGGGFRYNIGKRMDVGAFWEFRMLFNDDIDGIKNGYYNGAYFQSERKTNVNNNDWYNFFGVYVTYKIFHYFGECPTYDDMTKW